VIIAGKEANCRQEDAKLFRKSSKITAKLPIVTTKTTITTNHNSAMKAGLC